MKKAFEEKRLLYKVQTEKDPAAFAELYDLYVGPIYRFIFFKLSHKQEAEDVTADVFLKCWQHLIGEKGAEVRMFGPLLYTIARHEVVEVYRRRSRRPEVLLDEEREPGDAGQTKAAIEGAHETERLLGIVKKLKQEYQEVVLFRYVEDFSTRDIAAVTGKSELNVRVTLHRALKKLKELTRDASIGL